LLYIASTAASAARRTARNASLKKPFIARHSCDQQHVWNDTWYFLPPAAVASIDRPLPMQNLSDLLQPLDAFDRHVFLSHRWLHSNHPDPDGDLWRWVRNFCFLLQTPESTGIWFDYCCLP
jgi:hypothetical protein